MIALWLRLPWHLPVLAGLILLPTIRAMAGEPTSAANDNPNNSRDMKSLRIAVCQTFCIDSDLEGNLRRIEYALQQAAEQRSQLACFPETALLGWINPEAHKLAEPIPGPIADRISKLAQKYELMICIGISEKDGQKLYDSAILVGKDGTILNKHRKINTLVELLDPPYTRGTIDEIRVVETPLGRIGLLICADTFKDDLVEQVGRQNPDLLLVPYGWAAEKGAWPEHGRSLTDWVKHTARRAGCPVVGTDVVGRISDGPWKGKVYGGQSLVVDRQGKVLGTLRDRDAEVRVFTIAVDE